MTSSPVQVERSATTEADDPRFEPTLSPWALVAMASLLIVVLVAFFAYGQVAPGA